VSSVPKTYEQQFQNTTSQQRRHMTERGRAVWSKDNKRLIKPDNPVTFTLAEYRSWVLEQFGDAWGSRRCHYGCGRWVTPADFIPDHFRALNRGGLNSLDNLVISCASCNDVKGEMDGPWFQYLLNCLAQMPESERNLVRERLAKSEKSAASVRRLRGRVHELTTAKEATLAGS
jgi:hypothetical protein